MATPTVTDSRPGTGGKPPPRFGITADGTTSAGGLLAKIGALAVIAAIAVWASVPLIGQRSWLGLAVVVVVTALLLWIYLSHRAVPLKYLVPGTLFLIAFQIIPVLITIGTAFTNFGDGHRGSKDDAIAAIESSSVQQVPGSPEYTLTLATAGDPATGDLVFLLVDPAGGALVGTEEGVRPLAPGTFQVDQNGKVTSADGFTVLDPAQAGARSGEVMALAVPVAGGTIRTQGLSTAFVGSPQQVYDPEADVVRDVSTGQTWPADNSEGVFRAPDGQQLVQGWQVNVGLRNFTDVFGNQTIRADFLRILAWNFGFALGTVALTFALGLLVALTLNREGLRGQRIYRSLLILPYAMPSVAMYLIWRDMFNTDFGLVNRLFGLDVNWFGNTATAMFAVLLVQLWLGYNYMFLVCTGALQAIPADLTEAAQVDGARPFYAFRTITFPLLLVALAPLLISSFAFNFNNFAGIFLVSEGGPFPPDNPTAGGTDILITYTYRLAFGGAGAQYGFAAAVSVLIFLIVAVISVIGFRRTHALEEIN